MIRLVLGTACILAVALCVALAPGRPLAESDAPGDLSTPEREIQNPAIPRSTRSAEPAALLINEDFGLNFPPTGWSLTTTNTSYTWTQGTDTYGPLDGDAVVNEDPGAGPQNEWLKSPTVNLAGSISEIILYFHFKMSYVRSISPDNFQDLEVWVSTNGGSTFPTMVWDESDVGIFQNYQWTYASVNLNSLLGKNSVKIAFKTDGTGGGPVDIDMVQLATFLCGDMTGDQVLTSSDVIFLVNYIFKGGPAPNPAIEADMNNNGVVNSSDIVFLVNHVFKAGPPPPCP